MTIEELQNKIKNFNFDFLKYTNPETKELNNKVILFSSILMFFNLNYFTISELEITGLKVIIEKNILAIILALINTYYFAQFYMSLKIDIFLAKIPDEFTEICDNVNSKILEATLELQQITEEYNDIKYHKSFDDEKLKILKEKIDTAQKNNPVEKLAEWQKRISTAIKYHNRNHLLNQFFPIIWYLLSIVSIAQIYIKKG